MNDKAKCKNCTFEMIEEMAKEIEKTFDVYRGFCQRKRTECSAINNCLYCNIATHLTEQGYRKIPEGSMVLTGKETDEQLEDLFIEYDEMGFYPSTTVPNPDEYSREYKKRLIYAIGQRTKEHLKDCIESNQVVEKRTRKETAKEILNGMLDGEIGNKYPCKVMSIERYYELAKQYEVEE